MMHDIFVFRVRSTVFIAVLVIMGSIFAVRAPLVHADPVDEVVDENGSALVEEEKVESGEPTPDVAENSPPKTRREELEEQIMEREVELNHLEEEITRHEGELNAVSAEAQTLGSEVRRLNISVQKFTTDIKVSENRVSAAELTIEDLALDIVDKEDKISAGIATLAEALRRMREAESHTFIEMLLSAEDITGFWEAVDSLERFETSLRQELGILRELKKDMVAQKEREEEKRGELARVKDNLVYQKRIVEYAKREKNTLLQKTKNKEENYRTILEEKRAQKEAFEQELLDLESALRIEIDPTSIPTPGTAVFAWPLDSVTVTQPFGNTAFARANAQVYRGAGHNGVDFRASLGTPVKAMLGGVVTGSGNTDDVRGCYSYGKWVLIRHGNGLSSLYAHLSVIKVEKGQDVAMGNIIGYSGNTGYSTGPHLHLGVYATQGVQIQRFDKSINCKNVSIPIAPLNAYLNPLTYLPSLSAGKSEQ